MASVTKRVWTHKGVQKLAWTVRYKHNGKHRSQACKSKKEADDFKRKVENEMEAGSHVARRESRTVADGIDEYLVDLERRNRDGKVGNKHVHTMRWSLSEPREALGDVLLRDLTWQKVEAFYWSARRQHAAAGRTEASTAMMLRRLSTFIDYAVRRGYTARNVVSDAKREIGAPAPQPIDTFTRDEIRQLLVALEAKDKHRERTRLQMRAMVYIAVACGLRKGEIAALTWDAIDLERGLIHVRHNLTFDDVVKAPKTRAGLRTVTLPMPVRAALLDYAPEVVPEERGLIFRSRKGGEIAVCHLYLTWHALLDRIGLARRNFHALRHFAGSAWLDAGMPLTEVSRLLGHSNPAITAKVYSHAITGTDYQPPQVAAAMALIAPPQQLAIAQELRNAA